MISLFALECVRTCSQALALGKQNDSMALKIVLSLELATKWESLGEGGMKLS